MERITKNIEGCIVALKKDSHIFKCYVVKVFENDNAILYRHTDWPTDMGDENGLCKTQSYFETSGYNVLNIEKRIVPLKKQNQATSKIFNLPYGIVVELDFDENGYGGGSISSDLYKKGHITEEQADVIESVILSHACNGIDISTKEYVDGIENTVESAY
jgi:hypothetical protein